MPKNYRYAGIMGTNHEVPNMLSTVSVNNLAAGIVNS